MESSIIIKDLFKTFNNKDYILKGLNLNIFKGKITVIIGFSGTGKSVLLKHMLGLFKPSSGSIKVLNENLFEMSSQKVAKFRCNFGVLFQSAALFDDMTAIENVCFPLLEHKKDLNHEQVMNIAKEKLELVSFEEKHYNKLPSEISGGMQKRVGLARALALDPKILFYDEPTTGLDPILTERVDELIYNTHHHKKGITSVIISHDIHSAFNIGDYVAMLDNGKVLLFGTPDDFLKSSNELVQKFVKKGLKQK